MLVTVIVPSLSDIKAFTTRDLINMCVASSRALDVGFLNPQSSFIQVARNQASYTAMKNKSFAVLMADSDVTFPPDTLFRLLDQIIKNKWDIIGCNFSRRLTGEPIITRDAFGNPMDYLSNETVEVPKMGTGLIMITAKVFEEMSMPWFDVTLTENPFEYESEDTHFSEKAKAEGFKLWCDCKLSQETIHWGLNGYKLPGVQ